MSIGLRIKDLRKEIKISQKAFAEAISIDSSQMSKIELDKIQPTLQQLMDISSFFKVTTDLILLGKESQINKTQLVNELEQPNLIPLFDGVAVGGTSEVAYMDSPVQTDEYINAGDWFKDATAAMRVHGDSMAPEYKPGSIVALKNVNDKRLIVYGQDYVIETSEYRVIKRLQRSDFNDCWSCYSINNETYSNSGKLIHEPFDVPVDAVSRLYRVLGNVTRTESSRIVLNSN